MSAHHFFVYSGGASAVWLCLFDEHGHETRVDMQKNAESYWEVDLPDVPARQRYGYRADGPWAPEKGLRFNVENLLLDPYAKAIDDTNPAALRSIVIDPSFDWGGDRAPRTPWRDTVIYEAHLKGLTRLHPAVPEPLRGTYLGLAQPEVIEHLQHIGVTAIELLPVHAFLHDGHLLDKGLVNYWGYNSIAFFAPHAGYASTRDGADAVAEFKAMVKALHQAGIEVILDVVYNHTAEGNQLGPTLSFKGLDNPAYYALCEDPQYYENFTGAGNTVNAAHPVTSKLILDSLRYWVSDMHVDGFRFDLASTVARHGAHVDPTAGVISAMATDPVLAGVKLIAEPWDIGPEGYAVGRFPPPWREWNDRYRDAVRDFWRSEGAPAEFARRIDGSRDILADAESSRSINFVTAHDGFTLRDLVSYNGKHNDANQENNADGSDNNRSWNCGVEGPTDDPGVNALRARLQRSQLATLLLAGGTPMLVAGDELGRSQGGNNNAYCLDSTDTWIDWSNADAALAQFVNSLTQVRRRFGGALHTGSARLFAEDGAELPNEDALGDAVRVFGKVVEAHEGALALIFNGSPDDRGVVLPETLRSLPWKDASSGESVDAHETVAVAARELRILSTTV